MEKSNLALPDNAKRAVSEVLAPDDGGNERSDDVCQALLASGIFSKTDPAALSRWCQQLEPVRFPPGHVVGARGDFGGRLYVIVSGKVKVSYRRPGGCETMLSVLGSYEIIGGVQLFDPAACETSVTTLTEVLAVPIGRSYLLMWMAECSEFSALVLRLFARWAKETTNALTDYAFADVQGRVASRLLWLRKRFGRREGEVVRIVIFGFPRVAMMTATIQAAAIQLGDPHGAALWAGTAFNHAKTAPAADIVRELAD
jgi:CRP-like cAMP-binding protein